MPELHVLLVYMLVALLSYMAPGADWVIVSRYARRSRPAGLLAAAGVQTGLLVHMLIGALGAISILALSPRLFMALQLLGAAYLLVLGWRVLQAAAGPAEAAPAPPSCLRDRLGPYRDGFVSNVLNPKAILFFASILPQFVVPRGQQTLQILVLGLTDIGVGLLWWPVFVGGIHAVAQALPHPALGSRAERWAGVVLCLAGTGFALKQLLSVLR